MNIFGGRSGLSLLIYQYNHYPDIAAIDPPHCISATLFNYYAKLGLKKSDFQINYTNTVIVYTNCIIVGTIARH